MRSATPSPLFRRVVTALLLVGGVQFWLFAEHGLLGTRAQDRGLLAGMLAGLAVALLAPARARAWLRKPVKHRAAAALLVGLAAWSFVFGLARLSGNTFTPAVTDEQAYVIQARAAARGRLWMPAHELTEAFASQQLITDRAYASKYPPGAAICFAIALRLGLPIWVVPVTAMAAAAALLFDLAGAWLGRLAGFAGAVTLVADTSRAHWATWQLSHPVMLALVLVTVWTFEAWRRRPAASRAAGVGLCVGMGFITRPVDTLCLAAPMFLAACWTMRRRGALAAARHAAIGAMAVAPFLGVQLLCNRNITGHWLMLPWMYYTQHNNPYDVLGVPAIDPSTVPTSVHLSKNRAVAEARWLFESKRSAGRREMLLTRLYQFTDDTLSHPLLAILLPVGLLRLRGAAILVVFFLALVGSYAMHTYYCSHYALVVAPGLIVWLMCGMTAAADPLPWPGVRDRLAVGLLAALAVSNVAMVRRYGSPLACAPNQVAQDLRAARRPAIVLFVPGDSSSGEPVYNLDVAWPDDAPLIRAHDLPGPLNRRLFEYYARRQPDRMVYRYHAGGRLEPLGNVRSLAATNMY